MAEAVVLQVGAEEPHAQHQAGNNQSTAQGEGSRFTWRHFVKRTRVQLAVALCIFAAGLGTAAYLFVVLQRWQGRTTHPPPRSLKTCRLLNDYDVSRVLAMLNPQGAQEAGARAGARVGEGTRRKGSGKRG